MKNWKSTVLASVAVIGLAGLAACSAMQGASGTAPDGYSHGTPDTRTIAYPKDPVGLLSSSHRQTITMPIKQQCAHFAACTPEEQERIVNGCDVARDAWGPSIRSYVGNGAIGGGATSVGALALGGALAGFSGPTILTNTLFDAPLLVTQYAYNGGQYGVIESFAFDQKCQSAMLQASGIAFLDSRPVSKGSPKVIALLPNGQPMPRGYVPQAVSSPLFDTSQLSRDNAKIVDSCQTGLDRNDPFLVDKFNACLAKSGKPPLPPNLFRMTSEAAPLPVQQNYQKPSAPAPKGKGRQQQSSRQPSNRWSDN